jgi:ADP-ribose pyrophosphatase YjhB (NUDIX family)
MWAGGVRVVVRDEEGRILLVRQRHEGRGIWMLPGGAIEANETSREAAAREVLEETGLTVQIGRLLWHIEEVSEPRGQRFVNFFLARVTAGSARLGTDPELGEAQVLEDIGFFSRAEAGALDALYPEALRDEVWIAMEDGDAPDVWRLRE